MQGSRSRREQELGIGSGAEERAQEPEAGEEPMEDCRRQEQGKLIRSQDRTR